MKATLLLALTGLFILLSSQAFSQGFRPGFIVQTEGDTIRGLIKYRENDRNYENCIFKRDTDAVSQEYKPNELAAYGITNDALFESKEILDAKQKKTVTFVEVLVHGSLSLYQYQELFFLEKEKGELKLLSIETDDPSLGGAVGEHRTVTTSTQHLILLNSLTFDCPVPEDKMAKVMKKITAPHIVAIVQAYNNCKQPIGSVTYKQNKAWMAVEKGALLGMHATSLNYGSSPYLMKNADFPLQYNILAGGYLNVMSPRKSERVSLHLELFYSHESYNGYLELSEPITTFRNDYNINIRRLSLVSMGRYSIVSKGKANPYLGVGISNNIIIGNKGLRRIEKETTINGKRQIETTILDNFQGKNFYAALTAAVGTSYKFDDRHKFLFQARYERGYYVPNGSSQHPDLTNYLDNSNSFYLTAAYILR